jgi:DNA-binding transcriptional ArsR family regulator
MAKTISASAMRDRLLNPAKASVASNDWVRVLAIPGHRELLGLIARNNPLSIGALAELAGRAQPNISRALTALVGSGLITLDVTGRRSVPRLTENGAARALELGLLGEAVPVSALTAPNGLFSIAAEPDGALDSDTIVGSLITWLWLTSAKEQVAAQSPGDLDAIARRVLENWWRLHYRRDAPFKLWEFEVEQYAPATFAFLAKVQGANIHLHARSTSGRILDLEHASRVFAVNALEDHLLNEVMRPLAARHWLAGRSARPLHALLRRIDDSREQPAERTFCRTAGALGLSPYDLDDRRAGQIRELIALIDDEEARLDFSSAVLGEALDDGQVWTRQELEKFRERNAMPVLVKLREICASRLSNTTRPYRQGYALARIARDHLGLNADVPIDGVTGIAKHLGAENGLELSGDAPGMLRAFQSFAGDVPTFIVEDEGTRPSAFTLARSVGDFLAFGSRASCVAGIYTDRQAVGRAFAAEFLAPRSAVEKLIEQEDQSAFQIANYFGVSPAVVERQYQNVEP